MIPFEIPKTLFSSQASTPTCTLGLAILEPYHAGAGVVPGVNAGAVGNFTLRLGSGSKETPGCRA